MNSKGKGAFNSRKRSTLKSSNKQLKKNCNEEDTYLIQRDPKSKSISSHFNSFLDQSLFKIKSTTLTTANKDVKKNSFFRCHRRNKKSKNTDLKDQLITTSSRSNSVNSKASKSFTKISEDQSDLQIKKQLNKLKNRNIKLNSQSIQANDKKSNKFEVLSITDYNNLMISTPSRVIRHNKTMDLKKKSFKDLCITSRRFQCFRKVSNQDYICMIMPMTLSTAKEREFRVEKSLMTEERGGLRTSANKKTPSLYQKSQNHFGLNLSKVPLLPFKSSMKSKAGRYLNVKPCKNKHVIKIEKIQNTSELNADIGIENESQDI
ncbi:unnamed protein product [Moneuplotes crassus]|uniref:Uncharacterized protein n=1 Tax=Euplotes crassus TaxID=5936 RepID=A0AAD1UBI8_EUPCR|nr:unnamed protein product [Moneuplotes crassus]